MSTVTYTCSKCDRGASGLHVDADGNSLCIVCYDRMIEETTCPECGELWECCTCHDWLLYGDLDEDGDDDWDDEDDWEYCEECGEELDLCECECDDRRGIAI